MPSQSGIGGPPHTITGLTASTAYDVRVRASNSAGTSAWSSWQQFTTTTGVEEPPPTGGRPTKLNAAAMTGPYYTAIPSSPVLDTQSAGKSSALSGIPKYCGLMWVTACFAVDTDPMYSIVYGQDPETQPGGEYDWAAGDWAYAEEVEPIRIPDPPNFYPQPGGYADGASWDGWGCVIDMTRDIGWAGWRMAKVGGNWQAATSHAFDLTDLTTILAGGGRGDGLPSITGSITVQEVAAAMADGTDSYVIPHALAGSIPAGMCDSQFRAPATKTDGTVAPSSSTISQGSRFYLPAATAITSSNRLMRAIARTLKTYGIYIVDRNGGSALMLNFERFDPANPENMVTQNTGATAALSDPAAISRVYYDAGLTFDYANITSGVPWGSLQLLRNWQGT